MRKNTFADLSNEQLLKKRKLIKGVMIGFGIVVIILIALLIILLSAKGFKDLSIVSLIPLFTLPISFLPLAIISSQLDKEIKARNI